MEFDIYSYWNIAELQLVFNAVAAVVGSPDYLGLLQSLALVGILSMAMAVLAGFSQLPDFGRWVVMFAVFNGMLLVPKTNVVLIDRTGSTAPVTVANVPLGLAAFAHSVSHVGDWLTNTFETVFSLPNDIQFRTNGTLFGHRVQQEILHTKFDNSILNSNLLEFYRECVVPEYSTGYIVASDMAKSNDIWTYLSGKTNPGLLVTLAAVPGAAPAADTYNCDVAYSMLGMQIDYVNTKQMNALGRRLYPGLPTAAANTAIQSAIQTSTNYMLGISTDAMSITKQTAMSNFMIDAQYMLPAQLGDSAGAAANLGQAQAIRSTSESYKMMASLAESTMPKVKNIVELVQYAIFPIIMLLVLMAGHKGGLVIKAYVMSLLWVQLWPPLYAVMHLIMTMHAQEFAAMTNGLGLSMSQYSFVNNAYLRDEGIAGMIAATAIPAIAAAIVKGGDVGAQAIGGMVSPSREAEKVASGMATGSFSMGSASLGSQSASNLSMGQMNTKTSLSQGGHSMTGADNVGHFYGANGEVINNSAAFQQIGANAKLSGRTAGSLQSAATSAERAGMAETVSAASNITAARDEFKTFDRTHAKDTKASTGASTTSAAQVVQGFSEMTAVGDKFAASHGLKQDQAAKVMAYASAEVKGGIQVPLVGGAEAKAGTGIEGSSSSTTSQDQKLAHELAQNKEFKAAVQKIDTASKNKDFTKGDAATVKAAQGIVSNLQKSESHVESAAANFERSNSYQEAATRTREMGAAFDTNHNNEFMGWMEQQQNPTTGKNFTANEVSQMSLLHPDDIGKYAQRFSDERLAPEIEKNIPAPTNTVGAQHAKDVDGIPTAGEQQAAFKNQNDSDVTAAQNKAGVNPNTKPVDNVTPQVNSALDNAGKQIHDGQSEVKAEGDPLKQSVTQNTDPTHGSNALRAATNAVPAALGSDSTKLLDRAGVPLGSVAQQTADENHGSLTRNIVGAALEGGSLVIGGAGGKVATEGVGLATKAGKAAGDAAEATALKVAAKTEERIAANSVEKVAETGATQVSDTAAQIEARKEAASLAASRAAAKAEVGVTQTTEEIGKGAGAIGAGAATRNLITGDDGVISHLENAPQQIKADAQAAGQAIKKTNDDVLNIASDVASEAKNIGNQAVEKITKK